MIIALKLIVMKIAIYSKENNTQIVELIKAESNKYGFSFDDKNPDVVFSVGGDGTFLRAVHEYLNQADHIKFIGINSGSLGFLYDFSKEDIPSIMKNLNEEKCDVKNLKLLQGDIRFKNSEQTIYALNEIRLENPFHTLISEVFIDDELLETYRGNGLIVSSSLGSSAYNKSLGGALIDTDLDALELTEIAGIENNIYRSLGSSLVIKGDKKVTFSGNLAKSVVGNDHLNIENDDILEKVTIYYSNKSVKIIYKKDHSYVQKIRKSFVLWY